MELSLKKYLSFALKLLIPFVITVLLCIGVCFVDRIDTGTFCLFVIPISSMILLFPGIYYLIMFFLYKKKCKNHTPTEGVIFNWETGFFRYSGSVIIKADDREYATSAYFSHEECKDLVGRTAFYAIIDEMLFIYQIKD